MQKITFTRREKINAVVLGVVFFVVLLLAISQKVGLGQAHQRVSVNGTVIGHVNNAINIEEIVQQARRELAAESEERLCVDFEWELSESRKLFVSLLTESELKEQLKETLTEAVIRKKERVYTVAIEDYRANFSSIEDVKSFLDQVKASSDEDNLYQASIRRQDGHISGILNAVLEKTVLEEKSIPESTAAEEVSSGIIKVLAQNLSCAFANPSEITYEQGILNMEFVEEVEVYENYVDATEISDIEEEVLEVTKEKESNKIYVVESGDCLSVIAMDHDTTVSSILALNDMKNVNIREGQELIIAVPEPDLKLRISVGEVYEEEYTLEPVIIENNSWYTNEEVVHKEGAAGRRERNDIVVYENGMEVSRTLAHQKVIQEATAAVIERGTIIPPTYIKPLSGGQFTSGFGLRWGRMHKGADWACSVGTTVYASCGGTVIQASYNGGFGNNVVISHPDGRMTRYAHNSKLLVKVGQVVEQGEPIALSGNTGRSTGPHVHFELYINGVAVNPLNYIGN